MVMSVIFEKLPPKIENPKNMENKQKKTSQIHETPRPKSPAPAQSYWTARQSAFQPEDRRSPCGALPSKAREKNTWKGYFQLIVGWDWYILIGHVWDAPSILGGQMMTNGGC